LQYTMDRAYKQSLKPFKKYMEDYASWLVFNIESEPAVRFLRKMQTLHLSERDGSIYKTTKQQILTILRDWVRLGKSYWEIAREIRDTQPFVFSKARAKLIAVQETWQAYGWANFEPAKIMSSRWFKMEKHWWTSRDDRVRPTHTDNMKQWWIDIKKIWTWTWDMYAPSKEFNCRCTSTFRIVW
jgi:hypothetical protein